MCTKNVLHFFPIRFGCKYYKFFFYSTFFCLHCKFVVFLKPFQVVAISWFLERTWKNDINAEQTDKNNFSAIIAYNSKAYDCRACNCAMLVIRRVWMEWNTFGKKPINFYKDCKCTVYVCSYNYPIKFLKIVGKFKRNEFFSEAIFIQYI